MFEMEVFFFLVFVLRFGDVELFVVKVIDLILKYFNDLDKIFSEMEIEFVFLFILEFLRNLWRGLLYENKF